MSRNFQLSIGEYYHIYNRGTEKRKIFLSEWDRIRFTGLLYAANSAEPVHTSNDRPRSLADWLEGRSGNSIVDIGAWVLMPNHFHILLKEKTENGISMFMQKISTAYTMYFNIKNKRTGSLFSGRFKAIHVDSDEYLKYLMCYIHLNPIKLINHKWKESGIHDKKKAKHFLENYPFSSYLDYSKTKNRLEGKILKKKSFPEYFPTESSFEDSINYWLNYKELNDSDYTAQHSLNFHQG